MRYLGKTVLVFDGMTWMQGPGDIGDNACFWRRAIVVKDYRDRDGMRLVDVRWCNSGILSRGHFASGVKEIVENMI